MLQLSIDPSIISKQNSGGAATANIAIAIAGISWKKDGDPFPTVPPSDSDLYKLYPWKWAVDELPSDVKIYWVRDDNVAIPGPLLKINYPSTAEFEADMEILKKHYEHLYRQKLFKDNVFHTKELFWNYDKAAKQDIEFTDETPVQTPGNEGNTGFFSASTAKLGQTLAPLNQLLNLVYFCAEAPFDIPAKIKRFIAFPQNSSAWEGGNPALVRVAGSELFFIQYGSHNGIRRRCYCEATPLNSDARPQNPIKLRDSQGNFLGHVELAVSDVEDSVPELILALSNFFDAPSLFLKYLIKNKDVITQHNAKKINDFLWAATRDALGFGYLLESDDETITKRIVRKHCDIKYPEVDTLDLHDQLIYWNEYEKLLDELEKVLKNFDQKTVSLKMWKHTLMVNLLSIPKDDKLSAAMKSAIGKLELDPLPPTGAEENVDQWLAAWDFFLKGVKDDMVLQNRIAFVQWDLVEFLNIPAFQTMVRFEHLEHPKLAWFEDVFSNAGDLRLLQQEAIAVLYKKTLLTSFNSFSNGLEDDPAGDCVKAIKEYLNDRITNSLNLFFPVVSNPFADSAGRIQPPGAWDAFISSLDDMSADIKTVVKREIEKVFDIPPHIQIRVDQFENPPTLSEDDLNDEIAGHIVLMRRAQSINQSDFSAAWRYLNWAKVTSKLINDPPEINPTEKNFEKPFVVPAFLAETDGNKVSFLELSNEKLSLIAGHDTFPDSSETETDDTQKAYLEYRFDKDPSRSAYALWYGFHYQFAGFISLNSGVLPEQLRRDTDVWNIPHDNPSLSTYEPIATYQHYRRVPVSKVRVEAKQIDPVKGELHISEPPEGLLPLAFELPHWKGNIKAETFNSRGVPTQTREADLKNEQVHYLLSDYQREIVLRLKKPTTSFWNWYAWLGPATNEKCDTGKTFKQEALEREVKLRKESVGNRNFTGRGHLCDPAIENKIIVVVWKLFPVEEKVGTLIIDLGTGDYLSDLQGVLNVQMGAKTLINDKDGHSITVAAGDVVRIMIHSLVQRKHFHPGQNKFHPWMDELTAYPGEDGSGFDEFENSYLSKPVEIWFEAARKPELGISDLRKISDLFWRDLQIISDGDAVIARMKKTKTNYDRLAYFSTIDVKHQVWNWNGRLDASGDLLTEGGKLDPEDVPTTKAMEWEAWAFSDRPDFSSLTFETNLTARIQTGAGVIFQDLYKDIRPGEQKALYYRFTITAHWRYERLGKTYAKTINSEILPNPDANVTDKWRRFLRKCNKTKQLPKPSIRFVIPLTRSIEECREENKITSASVLIVLDDRWFAEAGLAETLHLGIELLPYPALKDESNKGEQEYFLNAGNDPTLTGDALNPISMNGSGALIEKKDGKNPLLVLTPRGPIGLTFDFAIQSPKLIGCAFVAEIPTSNEIGLTGHTGSAMEPWSLMEISVRRALREKLCEPGLRIETLNSEWTAKEWVQFLPAIDSFIPGAWRKEVSLKRSLAVTFNNKEIEIDGSFLEFDPMFNDLHDRYLVVTEKVFDIGGQPCEKYTATYKIENPKAPSFVLNEPDDPKFYDRQEGYLRILMVRKSKIANEENNPSIWEMLFGNAAKKANGGSIDFNTVQNDPGAALPLTSERIPYRMFKKVTRTSRK